MTEIIYESFVIMCQIVLKHENTKVFHQILRGGEVRIKLHWSKITVPATFWFTVSSKRKEKGEKSHFSNCRIVKTEKLQEIPV